MEEVNWAVVFDNTLFVMFIMICILAFIGICCSIIHIGVEYIDRENKTSHRSLVFESLKELTTKTKDKKIFNHYEVYAMYKRGTYSSTTESAVLSALNYLCKVNLVEKVSKYEFKLTEHTDFDKMFIEEE